VFAAGDALVRASKTADFQYHPVFPYGRAGSSCESPFSAVSLPRVSVTHGQL
jgi:hypothetical protein